MEPAPRPLCAGLLAVQFGADGLRGLCWNGVEVQRAVQFLLRTPGWGTPAPAISGLEVREDGTEIPQAGRLPMPVLGLTPAQVLLLDAGSLEAFVHGSARQAAMPRTLDGYAVAFQDGRETGS